MPYDIAFIFARFADGLILTLKVLLLAIPGAMVVGLITGIARVYGNRFIRSLFGVYVGLLRGTPFLVTLLFIYFGLPQVGIRLPSYWAFVIGWSLCSGAYQSEYIRGAIRSISEGQTMAAQSLGMSKFREIFHIILPQAFRRALPGLSNEVIYGIKGTALAYVVAYPELLYQAKHLNITLAQPVMIFLFVGFIYIVMTFIAQLLLVKLEGILRIPGLEVGK